MANHTELTKSPLVEALLDIKVNTDPNIPEEIFAKYHTEIFSAFPIKTVNTVMHASVAMKPGEPTKFDSGSKLNGFVFKSADGNKLIQFRRDGYTFNLVHGSYKNWNDFSKEAKKHFEKYLEIVKPQLVKRIAIRCINLIELPLPFKDFKEYILTVPEIGPALPQQLTELFMRIVIPDEKKENVAIVTEGIDLNKMKPDRAILPFIFDIDVFRLINLEPNADIIWEKFESIRKYRTEIFFNSLTEKTITLLK